MARRRRSNPKRNLGGRQRWLFGLLFLAAGLLIGIQFGNWTAPKKASMIARESMLRVTPPSKAAPTKPSKPAAPKLWPFTSAPDKKAASAPAATAPKPSKPAARPAPAAPAPVPMPYFSSGPKIAIVLDDWGYNLNAIGTAVEINAPLTLAVLPHLRYSATIAEKAHAAGHEIMLHMPMEPVGNVPLEEGTILTTMNADQIRSLLSAALANVPYVQGVNNHMGSKGTQDRPTLHAVMAELDQRGLFFLNSMTSGSTAGRDVAGELGIRYAERDIFLDNVRTEEAVLEKLEQLKQMAIRQGSAIGIGHDKPVTLQAIQKVMPTWQAQGIRVMKLSDLIRSYSEEN